MTGLNFAQRQSLADTLRSTKDEVAELITRQFIELHPEWQACFTDAGRKSCLEDACYHVDFLAGAIEAGTPEAFKSYVRWLCNVLRTRNIPAECVSESLGLLADALYSRLFYSDALLARAYIMEGRAVVRESPESAASPVDSAIGLTQNLYLQTILAGKRKAAVTVILEALRAGMSAQDLYVSVLQESLYEVGRLWEANKISVAEEHLATAITQFVVAQLYSHIEPGDQERGVAVVTGVQGEMHQVGANMVADMMEIDGWDVHFLGTNTPPEGVLLAIRDQKATLLGISITMIFNMPKVVQLIEAVRAEFGAATPRIVVGGGAFRQAPELWREIGADGYAPDLRSALTVCQSSL